MPFSKKDEMLILQAIQEAEAQTTGEIRVYVEDFCLRDHPVERAAELFHLLDMYHTKYRNAVLIYLAEKSQHFAIWGDVGLHNQVGYQFWDTEKQILREYLQKGKVAEGLRVVILQIGEQMHQHFPKLPGDTNELPDAIIYG